MELNVVALLQDLVATPSVNPMGRGLEGPEFLEYRMTDLLESHFKSLGLQHARQSIAVKRDNILVRLDGEVPLDAGGQILLLEAHQDTVPVDGMTVAPWTPEVRDGRVYGRGACDIKGGMAAMLAALARLAADKPAEMPTIVLACTVNEEHGYTGATALVDLWQSGESPILPRRPDAVIVAEPTDLRVVVAHKGAVRWRCVTRGRAVHSSQPDEGENAIYMMSRVIAVLEDYHQRQAPLVGGHPLCGRATLSVGTIAGGISVNTVPDECVIEVDRRLLPGENPLEAYQAVIDFVANDPRIDFEVHHRPPYLVGWPLSDQANGGLAESLRTVARETCGRGDIVGVAYGTDAATYAAAGVPAVVFGPGSISQAHTKDEWVLVEELESAAEIIYQFACARPL